MPPNEIELDPVDFVTVGTVGPKGRRLFHLQAGQGSQIVTLILEKEQARALAEAITEMLTDLSQKYPDLSEIAHTPSPDMSLRDPIDPLFRISQMGLGYDESRNMVVLVAQELVPGSEAEEPQDTGDAQIVRLWASREQMRALSDHVEWVVKQGRANPKHNGHLIYYWT